MKNSRTKRNLGRLVILFIALFSLFALAALSSARTPASATSVNIVNNSAKGIANVYLSHVNANDWGTNQLGDASIAPGQSFNLNNVACDQQQVKVIAEDEDGCFKTTVVNCGASSTWTITNATPTDCG